MIEPKLEPIAAPVIPRASCARTVWVCSLCHDRGTVFAQLKAKPGAPTIFRCLCDRGRADPRAFPLWKHNYDLEFEVMT